MKPEDQKSINEQEFRTRTKFINQFKNHFIKLVELDIYSGLDLSGITKNLQTCFIEIKERNSIKYPIENISGSTLLELKKNMEFRFINQEYPNSKLVYFMYFTDNDYFLSFDIKTRIDTNSRELLDKVEHNNQKDNYSGKRVMKDNYILKFNPKIDKMFYSK